MIAKAIKGKGFRGAVAYDLQKGKSVLLDSNMSAKGKALFRLLPRNSEQFGLCVPI